MGGLEGALLKQSLDPRTKHKGTHLDFTIAAHRCKGKTEKTDAFLFLHLIAAIGDGGLGQNRGGVDAFLFQMEQLLENGKLGAAQDKVTGTLFLHLLQRSLRPLPL